MLLGSQCARPPAAAPQVLLLCWLGLLPTSGFVLLLCSLRLHHSLQPQQPRLWVPVALLLLAPLAALLLALKAPIVRLGCGHVAEAPLLQRSGRHQKQRGKTRQQALQPNCGLLPR